jgi:hypothetical protein
MQLASCSKDTENDDVIVVDSPETVARLNEEIDRVQAHTYEPRSAVIIGLLVAAAPAWSQ